MCALCRDETETGLCPVIPSVGGKCSTGKENVEVATVLRVKVDSWAQTSPHTAPTCRRRRLWKVFSIQNELFLRDIKPSQLPPATAIALPAFFAMKTISQYK